MNDLATTNRTIVVASRPTKKPGPENFAEKAVPVRTSEDGEVLVESLYLSIDPAMRVWLEEDPGYVAPLAIGDVMRAFGVGRVSTSRYAGLSVGDFVAGRLGWQSQPTLQGASLNKLDLDLGTPVDWLGPLGTTGLTAYFGILRIGQLKAGETVLVSAAAGAVGQMVGQIARLHGARTVGIAGGAEKCALVTDEFGFDQAIDYKAEDDMAAAIGGACHDGVDVYFDNVGGEILDGALANIRQKGRVVVCGRISQTAGRRQGLYNTGQLIGRRARMEGFIVTDFEDEFDDAQRWLAERLKAGKIHQKIHVLDGLEQAPEGLRMLFAGENIGKMVVKVGA